MFQTIISNTVTGSRLLSWTLLPVPDYYPEHCYLFQTITLNTVTGSRLLSWTLLPVPDYYPEHCYLFQTIILNTVTCSRLLSWTLLPVPDYYFKQYSSSSIFETGSNWHCCNKTCAQPNLNYIYYKFRKIQKRHPNSQSIFSVIWYTVLWLTRRHIGRRRKKVQKS